MILLRVLLFYILLTKVAISFSIGPSNEILSPTKSPSIIITTYELQASDHGLNTAIPQPFLGYENLLITINGTTHTITEKEVGKKMYSPVIHSYELLNRSAYITFRTDKFSSKSDIRGWDNCYLMRVDSNLKLNIFKLPSMYTTEEMDSEVPLPKATNYKYSSKDITAYKTALKTAIKQCERNPFRITTDDVIVTGTITGDDRNHCESCKKILGNDFYFGEKYGIVYKDIYVTWKQDNHAVKIPFEAFCGIHTGYLTCSNPTGLFVTKVNENQIILQSIVFDDIGEDCLFVILVDKTGYTESVLLRRNYTKDRSPIGRYNPILLKEYPEPLPKYKMPNTQ